MTHHDSNACPSDRDLLCLASDMVVEEDQELALRAHVELCLACQGRTTAVQGLFAPARPALPADMLDRIFARIEREEALECEEAVAKAPTRRRPGRLPLGLVGAAAAALFAISGLVDPSSDPLRPATQSATPLLEPPVVAAPIAGGDGLALTAGGGSPTAGVSDVASPASAR